jgi:hypothetical protein
LTVLNYQKENIRKGINNKNLESLMKLLRILEKLKIDTNIILTRYEVINKLYQDVKG